MTISQVVKSIPVKQGILYMQPVVGRGVPKRAGRNAVRGQNLGSVKRVGRRGGQDLPRRPQRPVLGRAEQPRADSQPVLALCLTGTPSCAIALWCITAGQQWLQLIAQQVQRSILPAGTQLLIGYEHVRSSNLPVGLSTSDVSAKDNTDLQLKPHVHT